ncbi:hypothetical protein CEUSTIGMA_g6798.t1 [Chlamydomonas eustigma]|uniref:Uncharacterized protein n=1 Tax=Chlamydomonas eustigma TaxID=1157962 RepID=A0A250X8H1_9CHLO|nr:hypothetical protein CEUSTIGMA_g6798.t1 [Chlamydomonas eustigma]|eukprot:GAX79356.1 hypothetical protein CEUSTIGMA_g6798.t1 [Chlamydomonas eustigma]
MDCLEEPSDIENFESDKDECLLDEATLEKCPIQLIPISSLRPTQISVGMQQVKEKQKKIQGKKLKDKPQKRDKFLRRVWHRIPVVKGPANSTCSSSMSASESLGADNASSEHAFYMVDHHHLGLALLNSGIEDAYVAVIEDLTSLNLHQFWERMNQTGRVWSCDEKVYILRGAVMSLWSCDEKGMSLTLDEFKDKIPRTITDLRDDPFRSLSALLRKAGGYMKSRVPYTEFIWANYLRQQSILECVKSCAADDPLQLSGPHLAAALQVASALSVEEASQLQLPGVVMTPHPSLIKQ